MLCSGWQALVLYIMGTRPCPPSRTRPFRKTHNLTARYACLECIVTNLGLRLTVDRCNSYSASAPTYIARDLPPVLLQRGYIIICTRSSFNHAVLFDCSALGHFRYSSCTDYSNANSHSPGSIVQARNHNSRLLLDWKPGWNDFM